MNRAEGRARDVNRWVWAALSLLAGCSGVSPTASEADQAKAPATVIEAVRVATDRSRLTMDVVTLPDGTRMRRLSSPGGINHVVVGRVDANGQREMSCVDNAPAAEAFLAGSQSGSAQ